VGEAHENERGDGEASGAGQGSRAILVEHFAAVTAQCSVAFIDAWGRLDGIAKMAGDPVVGVEARPCETVVMAFAIHE
jgi:hypothetical protein